MGLISSWKNKSVFMTGHTGFKGAWMSMVLTQLGANVTGYALQPESTPNLFDICHVKDRIAGHYFADIRDAAQLQKAVTAAAPDVIFHLAAQSLVRRGYVSPVETFEVNVMGTVQVFEAARLLKHPCAVVNVTTDKVYENLECIYPFRETDPLGAADPYSTSKAAAELVAATWRKSFTPKDGQGMRIASVRAGNTIGGGDWAEDRLVPDCIRAFAAGRPAQIRNPGAVRPWQHALDPINGYMIAAQHLLFDPSTHVEEPIWNFGPDILDEASSLDLANRAADLWGSDAKLDVVTQHDAPREANLLRLDSTKAKLELDWSAVWGFEQAIDETISWYRAWADGQDMVKMTDAQITSFLLQAENRA